MSDRVLRERDVEVGLLDRALDDLVAGYSPCVAVTGEPGTGRSVLLRRAARRAAERGVRVLSGRGAPAEEDVPFGVALGLAGALDGVGRPPRSGPVGPDVLHRWCRPVLDAARATPLLIVVDDVHWADEPSREWLRMLLRRRHETPLGLLVAVNGTHDGLGWATAATGASDAVLRLRPLTVGGVRAAVSDAREALPDRAFTALARRATGGNPALLAATLSRLDPSAPPTSGTVPELLRCAATARREQVTGVLDGLGPQLLDALRAIAVCGPGLWPVADRIGGPGACPATRSALLATGLTRDRERPVLLDDVVADAVLGGLPPERRRELFATAARLALRAGLPEDDVADVLLAAPALGEPWTAELLARVANRRRAAHRHDEATALAVRALREPVPPSLRAPRLVGYSLARSRRGPRAAHRVLARVALDADLAVSPDGVRAVDMLLTDGDVGAARRALDVALRRCPVDDASRRDLLALSRLTDDLGYERHAVPRERSGTPVPDPGPDGDPDAGPDVAATRAAAAWALTVRGRERERATRLAGAVLEAAGPVPTMARVMAALTLEAAGHPDRAARTLRHLLMEIARDRYAPPGVLAMSALIQLRAGDAEAARVDARAAVAAAAPPSAAAPLVEAVQVLLHLEDDDRVAAAATAFAHASTVRDRPGSALLEYARGRVRLAEGRNREARDLFLRCGRLLVDRGRVNPALAPWRSAAASALQACDEPAAADRLARDEHRLARRWGAAGPVAVAGTALRALAGTPDEDAGDGSAPGGVASAARP